MQWAKRGHRITVFRGVVVRRHSPPSSVEHGVAVVDVPALLDDLPLPPDLLVAHPVHHGAPVGAHRVRRRRTARATGRLDALNGTHDE